MKLLGRFHAQTAIPTNAITAMILPQTKERLANQSLMSLTPLGASFEHSLYIVVLHDQPVHEAFQLFDWVGFG